MKQHHLFQQSLSGVALHLRSNIVLLCFFMGCISIKASNKPIPSQINAVYVFCMDFDIYTATNVTKEDFLSHYIRSGEIYRVVVNDPKKIEQLLFLLKSLRESIILNNKKITTSFYYKPIISKSNHLHLINTYPLDIRGLIVIEKSGMCTPIWMSNNYVEIDNTYYELSEDMREWVRRISSE